jgi:uncharacterized FlaG/YvyC family protein
MDKSNVVEFKRKNQASKITYKNYSEKLSQLIKKINEQSIPIKSPDEFKSRREFNIYMASLMRQHCD